MPAASKRQATLLSAEWALRLGACATLLGHGFEHLRWDAPFRALLWNQKLMEGPVRLLLGLDWRSYAENLQVDASIQMLIRAFGLLYVAGAVAALTVRPRHRLWEGLLSASALGLGFLAILKWMDQRHQVAQLIESTSQWAVPLLLIALVRLNGAAEEKAASPGFAPGKGDRLLLAARLAVAATFLGHGLYAVGWHPMPGAWPGMLMNTFGLSENASVAVIRCAGLLDLAVVPAIFIPWSARPALAWAMVWGLATALARPWANFSSDFPLASLEQWLHEGFIRLPHAAVPASILLMLAARHAAARAPRPAEASVMIEASSS